MRRLRVGLTGGIACGKSHVLRRLGAAGLHTLDLDVVAHEVMAPGGAAYAEVVAAFGDTILSSDGAIDRKALGARVFADGAARARLNAIVHPLVREEEARWVRAHAGERGAIFVTDAALLVEAGVHLRFDRLVVVGCSSGQQVRRLMVRDGIDEAAALARIESQLSVREKRRFAHFDVDTSGTVEDTDRVVVELVGALKALAESGPRSGPVPLARALGCLLHGPAEGPRGLTAPRLLHEIAASAGLEMDKARRLLVPSATGPWYRAAREDEVGPGPSALAGPLVLWAHARGCGDPAFLLGAAGSLALLTHRDPVRVASACLFAIAMHEVAVAGGVPADLEQRVQGFSVVAGRWAHAGALSTLSPVFRSASEHPVNPDAARRACQAAGGDPGLAGALVGLAVGAPEAAAPAEWVHDLEALAALSDSV